ncbi:MAG: chemotaxis protein CheB [Bacillota bacterium]
MKKLKVLIADKSAFYKKIYEQAVEATGLVQVCQFASNINIAMERLKIFSADVLITEIFGAKGEFIKNVKKIINDFPGIHIIITGGSKSVAKEIILCETAIIDYIEKPSQDNPHDSSVETIRKHLQGLFTQIMTGRYISKENALKVADERIITVSQNTCQRKSAKKLPRYVDIVLIASSTGGPSALESVLKDIPPGFLSPILVVQHMPKDLTKRLSISLDRKCALTVKEAAEGMDVTTGNVLISPGGFHMKLMPAKKGVLTVKLDSTSPVNGVRPSADVLFRSVAAACLGKSILAIVLTGMGTDGLEGIREIKKHCDCYCITQSEKTCVVYGMPRSIVEAGLSDSEEDLEAISQIFKKLHCGVR